MDELLAEIREQGVEYWREATIIQVKYNLEHGVQRVVMHGKYGNCKLLAQLWVAISHVQRTLGFLDEFQKLENLLQLRACLWGSIPEFLHASYNVEVEALARDWGLIPGRKDNADR